MFRSVFFPIWPMEAFDPRWDNRRRGLWGERAVARQLWLEGYRLVAHRWQSAAGSDLDLVAANDDLLLFCEVKVRTTEADSGWLEVVDPARIEHLRIAAAEYLHETRQTRVSIRFDAFLVEPQFTRPRHPRITCREAYVNPATIPGWKGLSAEA